MFDSKNSNIRKIILYGRKNWFKLLVFLILGIGAFLRFYDYNNRWGLASDQARDAIIGQEMIKHHVLPLTGPFSSVGAFTTGPIWYWLIGFSTFLYPSQVLTPWIFLSTLYVVVIYIMILIGREIKGNVLAIVAGLFTAVSNAQISESLNLTNPSGVMFFSTLSVYFAIKYIKSGRNLFLFLFPFLHINCY